MSKRTTRRLAAALALVSAVAGVSDAASEQDDDHETVVKLEDAPAAVQEAIKREARGAAIEQVIRETEEGSTVYEGVATIDGRKVEIEVAEDGKLIEMEPADDEDDGDDDGEDEEEIAFADAPKAVQKSLQDHAKGAKIDEIEKETENGKTVYEAEIVIDGEQHEITVAEDGAFISDELDDDDDDDEADDEVEDDDGD